MSVSVVFFGSPDFAVPSLRALSNDARFKLELVVTQPDRQAGRGRRVVEPAVKSAAIELNVAIWQPETLRSDDAVDTLSSIKPDLFIVVAYGEIFRRSILRIPQHGCLNIHPSLLPLYRGSSPIQAAILNGDPQTGVSIIEMVRRLDAGPVVAQQVVRLECTETGGELSQKLAAVAAGMLPDVASDWCNGEIVSSPQDETGVTFTRELTKADGRINWTRSASEIERQIRACSPWPTAWTIMDGRRLVVHAAEIRPAHMDVTPGSVFTNEGCVLVACGRESLRLVLIQPEGKNKMSAEAWFRGLRRDMVTRFDNDVS